MLIRAANEADLPAIHHLLVQTWHSTYDSIYGAERVTEITGDWHSLQSLKARLDRPGSAFLVARRNGEIAGMAFAAPDETGGVVLYQLYVLPAFQRKGIGSRLLAELETRFAGASTIMLEVERANAPARQFYERKGFARIGETGETGTLKYVREMK